MHGKHTGDFSVPVKLWVLSLTLLGVFLVADAKLTWVLTLLGLVYLAAQYQWKALFGYMVFYGGLSLLMVLIQRFGLRLWIFSEFYVFQFWWLMAIFIVSWNLITSPPGNISAFFSRIHAPTGIILGMLVIFRFFPTMRTELRSLRESMHNRGLTAAGQVLSHPISTFEYILVPMLMCCLQIADQLAVSAVSRGIETPVKRSSYYTQKMKVRDYGCIFLYTVFVSVFFITGGVG